MSVADAFADIALGFSTAFDGIYHDAMARWSGVPVKDDGGSITTPGTPINKACSVQVDSVTESMRADAGYTEQDMRLLVLSATLDGDLDTDAMIDVEDGPHAGEWMLATCERDPLGIYWQCRGRRLNVPGVDS